MAAAPSAGSIPGRLVEMSPDVLAAVLVDAAGNLIASSEDAPERGRRLADAARDLVAAADGSATEPAEQIEVHVEGGSVYATRSARHTLACVTRRLALPALVLYDLRRALIEAEAA